MLEETEYSHEQKRIIIEFDQWTLPIFTQIIEAYSDSLGKIVSLQKIALQELSCTTLIPIFEKISIMPLVGTIGYRKSTANYGKFAFWRC